MSQMQTIRDRLQRWNSKVLSVLLVVVLALSLSACGNQEEPAAPGAPVEPAEESPLPEGPPLESPPVSEASPSPSIMASPSPQEEASPSPEVGEASPPLVTEETAVTDLIIIIDTPDQQSLVGRQAQLECVQVQSVVGDTIFWVGPSEDQQLFVVLEEDPSAGPTEGQVDVNAGETVTLIGEIQELPSMDEARSQWGLSEANSAELENQQIYLHAQQVEADETCPTVETPVAEETAIAEETPGIEETAVAEETPIAGETPAAVGPDVTLNDITTDPAAYYGQTVTVDGAVNVVLSETAFSIADNTFLDLNEVVVISATAQALDVAVEADAPVTVRGTVQQLIVAEIEEEYGLDLDPQIEAEFEGRPVIIAESVEAGVENVTLDNITENPEIYAGETVTVNGGVDEAITEQAFTMADSTFLDTNEVLVVGATDQALDRALQTGSPVRVSGTVRTFNLVEVEEEIGTDLADAEFEEFEGQPVIIADSVVAVDPSNVTLEEIAEEPDRYVGRLVAVRGDIAEVFGNRAFAISTDELLAEDRVLVIAANEQILNNVEAELAAEQVVQVTGTVRQLVVADIERDFDLDLDPELEAEFEDRPVIIATNVSVVE